MYIYEKKEKKALSSGSRSGSRSGNVWTLTVSDIDNSPTHVSTVDDHVFTSGVTAGVVT